MNVRRWSFLLVGIAALGVLPSLAAGAEKQPRSVLEDMRALDKLVTYTETRVSLGELVQKVAGDTGVSLTAAMDVADEPVAVVVKAFPARALLEQIADLLQYRWTRRARGAGTQQPQAASSTRETASNPANPQDSNSPAPQRPNVATPSVQRPTVVYEIAQDLASRKREEELRQAAYAEMERRFQAVVTDRLSQAAAGKIASPIERSMVQAIGLLGPREWERLRRGEPVAFATEPGPRERRLPEDLDRAFRAARPQMIPRSSPAYPTSPEAEARFTLLEREAPERWAAATGYRVTFRMGADPHGTKGVMSLSFDVVPVYSGAQIQPGGVVHGRDTRSLIIAGARDDHIARLQRQPMEQRVAERERDPGVGEKHRFKPEVKPSVDLFGPGDGSRWYLTDLLPDLARVYGLNFIADAYWRSGAALDAAAPLAEPVSLAWILERMIDFGSRWERRGNLILIRNERWYLHRLGEIPLRLVRRWRVAYEQHAALPLEEFVTAATTLSEAQVETLSETLPRAGLYRYSSGDISDLPRARHVLRLYAALAPAQRQALWRGEPIPAVRMTPAQRILFVNALRHAHADRPVSPADIASGTLSLTARPMVRVREPGDGPLRFRTGRPAATDLEPRVAGAAGPADATRYHVTEIRLSLRSSEDKEASMNLIVPPIP
jgi:hypothetical protein